MEKIVKAALLVMVVLTLIYAGAVAHACISRGLNEDGSCVVKEPLDCGITKFYFAEKMETEPEEWNTTEELGVVFIKGGSKDTYRIYIVDEEKALPWMNGTNPEPYAVKYGDNFYEIGSLWVTPGIKGMSWQIQVGLTLGAGWIIVGVLLIQWRRLNIG